MEPTRIYCKQVANVMKKVPIHAMAHITGGGLVENVPRVLPEGTQVVIHRDSWKRPAISTGCRRKAMWPKTKCSASSITVSVSL